MSRDGIISTAADLDGQESPGAIMQWAIRFCQTPETFPVFLAWCRSIWPDCPYTDAEISDDLIQTHNLIRRALGGPR